MGQIGKEQIFFIVTAVIIALMTGSLFYSPYQSVRPRSGKKPEPVGAAGVGIAPRGEIGDLNWWDQDRAVFQEPREWTPLPRADLDRPPLDEPLYVPPCVLPAVGLEAMGKLRIAATAKDHDFSEVAGSSDSDQGPLETDGAKFESRDAEIRRRYDWVEVKASSKPLIGIIKNQNKYGLKHRREEDVIFQQIDPDTNRIKAQATIPRGNIKEGGIHLANNPVNRVEFKIREIPERDWNAGAVPSLLDNMQQVMAIGEEDLYAYRRAAEELAKIVELDPLAPRTYELLADCHYALLDFEAELEALNTARNQNVQSGGLIFRRARWLWERGARQRALDLLAEGAKDYATHRDLRAFRGRCFLDQGDVDAALREFDAAESASKTPETRREIIRMQGEALLTVGRLKDARSEASRILKIESNDVQGLELAAAAEYALGNMSEAARLFGRIAEQKYGLDVLARALYGQGLAYARSGEFDLARRRLERAEDINPLLGAAVSAGLSFLYEAAGNDDQALAYARRAVEHGPHDPYLHYHLGRQLRRAGEYEEAERIFRRALKLGVGFSDLFNELGYLSLITDDGRDAVRYLEESLAREDRYETKIYLAHAHLLNDDLSSARRTFESTGARSEGFLGLAFVDYTTGETSSALEQFQVVINEMQTATAKELAYAESTLNKIMDLESKQQWVDNIRWRSVGKGWELEERYGIGKQVGEGSFRLKGTQRPGTDLEQWTYLHRKVELSRFYEMEMELQVAATNQGRVGVGLVVWGRGSSSVPQPRAALMLAVDRDQSIRYLVRENIDDPNATWNKVGAAEIVPEEPFRLTLRRQAEGSPMFDLYLNGSRVGESIEMNQWRGSRKQQLSALFFVSAEAGKRIDAELNYAHLVEYLEP